MEEATKRSFWNFGIGGLIGAAIGGFGTYFAQQQVTLAENQYFMELDKLRLAIMVESTEDFETQLEELQALKEVREKGYRPVFETTLENDIAEVQGRIARVAKAKADAAAAEAATAEAEARRVEAEASGTQRTGFQGEPIVLLGLWRFDWAVLPLAPLNTEMTKLKFGFS